jgi:hypothetical protein
MLLYRAILIAALIGIGCEGKNIVLVAGDQEYRSEESIPALARILETRHGFNCTVLYSINRQTGAIDPSTTDNIPGLDALRKADLMIIFTRFLELPDEQMKEIIDYTNSGPSSGCELPRTRSITLSTRIARMRNMALKVRMAALGGRCWVKRGSRIMERIRRRARAV